jgi:hypothetical protein
METPSGFVKIAGNPYLTTRFVILIPSCLIILLSVVLDDNFLRVSPFLFLIPAFYFAVGRYMYYFLVSDDQLITRNHYFWWVTKTYNFNEITKITKKRSRYEFGFGKFAGLSVGIKIFTHDSRSKFFTGDTLETEHWKKLENIFIAKAIPFEDKSPFDK